MRDDGTEQKQFPATRHKLREARKRGEVHRTRDGTTALVTVAAIVALWVESGRIAAALRAMLEVPFAADTRPFGTRVAASLETLAQLALVVMVPFLGVIVATGLIGGLVLLGTPVFSAKPLVPDFDKVNPASGLKRIFRAQQMALFGMTVLKVLLLSAVFVVGLGHGLEALFRLPDCGLGCVGPAALAVALPIFATTCALLLLWALADQAINRAFYLRDMRMTRTELRREQRDLEGEPTFKGRRRVMARQMVETGGGAKQATLLLADGARTVVALRWVEGETAAPYVVAKGTGERARHLLDLADRAGVPVLDQPALAAAVLRRVESGTYVTPDLLDDVVAVFQRAPVR